MQTLFKKTFLKPLPTGAIVKTVRGKSVAEWIGKGGKKRTAPVETKGDGSQVIRLERKTWVARYRDADRVIRERSTGCTNKAAANVKLSEFVKESERIAAGVMTKDETELADWRHSWLLDAISDYALYVKSRATLKRSKACKAYLTEGANACSWRTLADLKPDRLRRYLDELKRDTPETPTTKKKKGKGPTALNERVICWVAFGAWLAGKRIHGKRANWNGEKRLAQNPFDGFGKYDTRSDQRRPRRALSENELKRLLKTAAERPLNDASTIRRGDNAGKVKAKLKQKTIDRLTKLGRERALIYKTLVLTGLRKGELASITVGQCRLDVERPYIDLSAADEKNGEGNDIPLRDDLAAELRQWIGERANETSDVISIDAKPSDELLFNVPSGLVRILNRDLEAAGIPKIDARGYSVDVHALRHSYGTLLSTSGVAPRIAQAAMRHSTIDLTMNTYTDLHKLDIHEAVNALPSLDGPIEQPAKATGTNGQTTSETEVVSLVSVSGHNPPDLRKNFDPKQNSLEDASRLVSPMVSPSTCLNGMIRDNSSVDGEIGPEGEDVKKPHESRGNVGLSKWALRDSNPRPSRCKRDALAN